MERHLRPVFLLMYYIISLFFMELILKISIGGDIFSLSTVLALIFIGLFSLFFFMLTSSFKPAVNYWITLFIMVLSALLYTSQYIYYKFFKTFYTVYSAGNAGQVAEFWKDIVNTVVSNFFIVLLLFLPVITIGIFGKKLFSYRRMKRNGYIMSISGISILYLLSLFIISNSGKHDNSAYDLYYYSSSPVLSVDRLGLLTTMRLDLQRLATGWTPTLKSPVAIYPEEQVPDPKVSHGKSTDPKDPTEAPEKVIVYDDQIMEIDFDNLIASETDEKIKEMHKYFQSVPPTKKNAFTGMFEGYNLIFITAEGFSSYAVHKEATPTLYKLVHEGYQFTDFYNPIWGVSTSDGEYVATQSLIPKSGVWSFYESGTNHLPFVMGHQMKNLGYKTVAYHNHTYDYYRRDVSHPNMGYDYKGVGNGLDVKVTWPESDLEMMEVTVPEFVNDEPFHAYYMTVSGHMLYNFTGNYIAYKNRELVKDLPYSEEAKAYLATQIELDRALEHLLNELEKAGVLDNTLIVLSADHYPYGLEKKTIDEFAGHKVEDNFELYKSTLIVYAKGMDPVVVDKPTSSLDILPTISNLLGVEYDSRLLMGRDIFADDESLVIFSNRSYITDKGRYNSVTNEFVPNKGVTVDDDYVKRMSAIVNSKFYYSTMILDHNYYAKVFK